MTRLDVVREHLALLGEALGVLDRHATDRPEDLRGDIERLYAIERALHRAIQNMLDLGAHLLADDFGRRFEEYRDIPLLLGDVGVLPSDLATRLAPLAGLRNILVHAYLLVRLDLLLEHVREDAPLLRRFATVVEAYADGP
ncbi:MAG: DUF86 domain-containing protein [Myxococcota bacterium]|nr:DUF86 domain-containing protein [Myxococcota bacterium]